MRKNLILTIRKIEGIIEEENRKREIITINKLLFYCKTETHYIKMIKTPTNPPLES